MNLDKDCYVKVNNVLLEAEFIGVYQYSQVLEPSIVRGGHGGGTVAYPIAVVKFEGKFKQVELSLITFKQ